MATRLYPPVTEEVLPAFCLNYDNNGTATGATININFSLNKAVAMTEIGSIVLRLRTISTNTYIIDENINTNGDLLASSRIDGRTEGYAITKDLTSGTCVFQITNKYNPDVISKLKVGQFYKVQIAFVDLTGTIGYWSTIATIKCVARPTVSIANYNLTDTNPFTNEILGLYTQDTTTGDSSEKVYSYRFQLWNSDGDLLDDTGVCLHNSSSDTSSFSSVDTFKCYKDLESNTIYYIQYSITTINGLHISSPTYQVISVESLAPDEDLTIIAINGLEEDYWEKSWFNRGDTWAPWEEGVIRIYPELINNLVSHNQQKMITGAYVLLRSSSKDNFSSWQEIRRFKLDNEEPYTKIIYDHTVEQGITYRYALQQYNRAGFYSKKVYSYKLNSYNELLLDHDGNPVYNDIIADFEDMFLYDGKRQLKIRFNPKVNSFKNDLQEQKIDTIGSKHPFIFRNGNVCYKEFPISGLISFQEDNAHFFMTDEDYNQMKLDRFEIPSGELSLRSGYEKDINNYEFIPITSFSAITKNNYSPLYIYINEYVDVYKNYGNHENLLNPEVVETKNKTYYKKISTYEEASQLFQSGQRLYKKSLIVPLSTTQDIYRGKTYSKTDLTSDNIASERYFKLSVLDWLTDGKPKLFRSPTEGNYIVRLLNVSLTPKNELGRMIHEFTCTAYEVADFNYDSLVSLGLLNISDLSSLTYQWQTQDIKNLFDTEPTNDYYMVDLKERTLLGVQCIGFAPGDIIRITLENDTSPLYITIGQTGTYLYEGAIPIINLAIKPNNDTGDFSRNLLLATQGYTYQKFDMISAIEMNTHVGEQLVGPVENYFEPTVVGSTQNHNDYWKSNNVYLTEDLKETNNGETERIISGVKIQPTELLYLHARRREVIPIFMYKFASNSPTALIDGNYVLFDGQPNHEVYFMLTPYGNGYINYKSISPNDNPKINIRESDTEMNIIGEERNYRLYTIKELVEFAINECNKDIFCLFEVYVPYDLNHDGLKEWIKYKDLVSEWSLDSQNSNKKSADCYGIYDPWLASQSDNEDAGWWMKSNGYESYNPTFTYNDEVFSLNEEIEVTMTNLAMPQILSVGNGTVLELIYRTTNTDYVLENENAELRALKEKYLLLKEEARAKISTYNTMAYSKLSGDTLTTKYSAMIQKLQDASTYENIVATLTNQAREKQIDILEDYFNRERALIISYLNQIKNLDMDLIELYGDSYKNSAYRLYGENGALNNNKIAYDNAINTFLNLDESLIYEIAKFKTYQTEESVINEVISQINDYIKHINNSEYNFINTINTILSNLQDSIMTEINTEIETLGNQQYVAQYIENLQNIGREIFFKEIDDNEQSPLFHKKIYELIHKTDENIELLQGYNILDSIWNEYFHIENQDSLAELGQLTYNNNEWVIPNLSRYDIDNSSNDISSSSYIYNTNYITINNESYSLVTYIQYLLDQEQGQSLDEDSKEQLKTFYQDFYGTSNNINLSSNNYSIADIFDENTNQYRINSSKLFNKLRDLKISLGEENWNIDNIWSNIKNETWIFDLPNTQKINMQGMVKNIIRCYLANESEILDNYNNAVACWNYKEEHSLTDEQLQIVNKQMGIYYNGINTAKMTELNDGQYVNNIIQDENGNIIYSYEIVNGESSSLGASIEDSINGWLGLLKLAIENQQEFYRQAYDNNNNNNNNEEEESELNKQINIFNNIIKKKNEAINQFKIARERLQNKLDDESISSSSNIKELLYEEKEVYNNVYDELKEIKDALERTIKILQNDNIISDAYLRFLSSYINYILTNDTSNNPYTLNELQQLLATATAMQNITLDESCNPKVQEELIENAWKDFLDKLSEVYNNEIKEKMGE